MNKQELQSLKNEVTQIVQKLDGLISVLDQEEQTNHLSQTEKELQHAASFDRITERLQEDRLQKLKEFEALVDKGLGLSKEE